MDISKPTELFEKKMSFSAIGLYGSLSCLKEDGEAITKDNAKKMNQVDSDATINKAWKELVNAGFLIETKVKDKYSQQYIYKYELA